MQISADRLAPSVMLKKMSGPQIHISLGRIYLQRRLRWVERESMDISEAASARGGGLPFLSEQKTSLLFKQRARQLRESQQHFFDKQN